MNALEPVINLLLFLTALSVAAERITTALKLRNPDLRDEKGTTLSAKRREQEINLRALVVGVIIAVLLKADLIAALNHLDTPWATLG